MTDKQQQALDKMAENERELGIQMQPEWLTDEEIEEVWKRVEASDFRDVVNPFARAIEAKLKEKIAVSKLPLWDGKPERVEEVGPSKRHQERND